MIGHKVTAK